MTLPVEVTFEILDNPAADGYSILEAAKEAGSVIGVRVLNGPGELAGATGTEFDAVLTEFSRTESLKGAVTRSVTLKNTFSANPPRKFTVGGP